MYEEQIQTITAQVAEALAEQCPLEKAMPKYM